MKEKTKEHIREMMYKGRFRSMHATIDHAMDLLEEELKHGQKQGPTRSKK